MLVIYICVLLDDIEVLILDNFIGDELEGLFEVCWYVVEVVLVLIVVIYIVLLCLVM